MKKLLVLAAVAMLASCARAPNVLPIANGGSGFSADDFLVVALEYSSPRELVGVNTFGPTQKAALCQRSSAALIAQAHDVIPEGHAMSSTCLHVAFRGPLSANGAVILQPFDGHPLQYVQVAVQYTKAGAFIGAQALSAAPDAKTCKSEARDILDSDRADGQFAPGVSVLIYCVPVPPLPTEETAGGIV